MFEEASETGPGQYQAHLKFAMAGDWVDSSARPAARRANAGAAVQRRRRSAQLGKLLNPSSIPALDAAASQPFDLMRVPGLGHLFRWRYARPLLQLPLLIVSVVMILHGLFGPTLAPKNLATTLSWLHFRGVLVLVLLCAGNFFCLACPFMLVRQMARRFFRPRFNWPRALRNKWTFGSALRPDPLYLRTVRSVVLALVDRVADHRLLRHCAGGGWFFQARFFLQIRLPHRTVQLCGIHALSFRGESAGTGCLRDLPYQRLHPRRGASRCRTWSRSAAANWRCFSRAKVGNMDCTFCLDCVHACPHDNIGILSRMPGDELLTDPLRSGIGYFSRRKDLAALAIVFTFGALLNAFGMVSPVYAVENWLGRLLHVNHEAPVLGLIFTFFLILEPVVLLGLAAWCTRTVGRQPARPAAAGGEIQLRPGPHRLRHVAGTLRFSLSDRTVHRDSGHAKRAGKSGMADPRRAALDADRLAIQSGAGHRNWIPDTRICRLAGGNARPGGRGFAG